MPRRPRRSHNRMPDEADASAWNFLSLKNPPSGGPPPKGPTPTQPAASPWTFLQQQQAQQQRRPPGAPPPPPPSPPPRWDGHSGGSGGGGGGNAGTVFLAMILSTAATAGGIHWRAIRDRIQQARGQQSPRSLASSSALAPTSPGPGLRLPVASAKQMNSDDESDGEPEEDRPQDGSRAKNGLANDIDAMSSTSSDAEFEELQRQLSASARREKDASSQVAELQNQISEFESELSSTTSLLTDLQKTLEKQMSARKAAERNAKELDQKLKGMLSDRGRHDDDTIQRLEAAEAAAQAARQGQEAAEAEVDRLKDVAAAVQKKVQAPSQAAALLSSHLGAALWSLFNLHDSKVQATSEAVAALSSDLDDAQQERNMAQAEAETTRQTGKLLEEELSSSRSRVRQLEGELRVAKENIRRMDDRMRGILRERSEMAAQIKQLSPAKPR